MKKHSHFLLFLIILATIGVFLVMKPFLISIFLAFTLATLFSKSNKKFRKKLRGHRNLTSFLMCLWIIIIIIFPIFILGGLVVSETNNLVQEFQGKNFSIDLNTVRDWPVINYLNLENNFRSNTGLNQFTQGAKNISGHLFTAIKAIYQGTSNFIFILVVCFFALYYFFKDGDMIIKKIMDLSPLPANQEKEIFEKFNAMTIATIRGTLVIALIQGLLMGTTLWIAGVTAPVLWGLVTALISIIPLLGAFLVWLPIGLVLLALGSYWQGIFVILVGIIIISSIDNFLRPKLIEGQTSLHPLLVFLATLGGIAFFGPLGFIIGPVIITLWISFLEIYQTGHVHKNNN